MHLKSAMVLILCGMRVAFGEENEEIEEVNKVAADDDIEVPLTIRVRLEDIDVLCSKFSPDSKERLWTWLDVSDLNMYGYWREYGICIDKTSVPRFRFRAFHLDHPPSYDIVKERCLEHGYDFAQPARLDPDRAVNSFGWPDRGFEGGAHGPSSYQLGSGRIDSVWERRQELANDGWYVFRVDQDTFTPGFVTVAPCKRVQLIKQYFELHEIPCQNYRKCW